MNAWPQKEKYKVKKSHFFHKLVTRFKINNYLFEIKHSSIGTDYDHSELKFNPLKMRFTQQKVNQKSKIKN